MKNRPIITLAVLVALICVGAIWFLQRAPSPLPQISSTTGSATPVSAQPIIPVTPSVVTKAAPTPPTPSKQPPAPTKPIAEWEMKVEQLLTANIPETETAQMLINLMPTLPEDGQSEVAQHISNLLPDKDYSRAMPLIKNTRLPEDVLDVLVTDLMNREDAVKLPALLEIAKLPSHPHQEEAITDLQIFLDVDHGTDWNKWNGAMLAYLKSQAEEDAAPPDTAPSFPGTPIPKP